MPHKLSLPIVLVSALLAFPAAAADMAPRTRAQALQALQQPIAEQRGAAVARLGEIGTMADADRLVARLHDEDEAVRLAATVAMWQIWGRSGNRGIDALYQRGIGQMEASRLDDAVKTFTEIIRRKPGFAEAWNKRATLYYMQGDFDLSLKDCAEVIKRNPNHFGALAGYGQIHLILGDLDNAAGYFERALTINPNLPGSADILFQIRQKLREKQQRTI